MRKFMAGLLTAAIVVTGIQADFSGSAAAKTVKDNSFSLLREAGDAITISKSTGGNPISGGAVLPNGELAKNVEELVGGTTVMYGGDPSILVDGDMVYLYTGHDIARDNGYNMPDWYVYSSPDMEKWTLEGKVMEANTSNIPWESGSNEAWAGQVVKYKDLYYFYHCTTATAKYGNHKAIGVAVADTPTGWSDVDAKAEYCEAMAITDPSPKSLNFVDIGHPLVQSNVTWPFHAGHDDIDPTAWIETDENGEEHRYLAWGNSWAFICELNEDMISVKDQNEDGLITMKTTRSLYTTDGSVAISYSRNSVNRAVVIDRDYSYSSNVTYYTHEMGDDGDYAVVQKTIPSGSSYEDGDIVCSKFTTENQTGETPDTAYLETGAVAVDNDGNNMAGHIKYDDDENPIGLYTYDEEGKLLYHFFTEAPYLYRRQDENGKYYGEYYLFFAVDWREQYGYATCDNLMEADWTFQGVIMPWTNNGDTSHTAVFDYKGQTYCVYHDGSLPYGFGKRRVACVDELTFDEEGKVNPIQETATGLTGITSWITDANGKHISHEDIITTRSDGDYPYIGNKSKKMGMDIGASDYDNRWEIVAGKIDITKDEYVSFEAWNSPGLYIEVSGSTADASDVVLSSVSTSAYSVPDTATQTDTFTRMTFKTVAGLAGENVSFESVYFPGYYLTSQNGDLVLTDGSDAEACTFAITNRAPLKSITATKTKTTYNVGDTVDTKDIKVTANYKDGTTAEVTDFTIENKVTAATAGEKVITVSYREDNFLRKADIAITVAAPVVPTTPTVTPTTPAPSVVAVNGIALSKTKATVKAGKSLTLTAAVTPANATDKTVSWISSKPSVATVVNGKVTAKKSGTTTITAKAGNVTATCTITVPKVKATKVKLNKKKVTLSLKKKKTIKLTATITPKNVTNKKLTWKSSKPKVATVKNGKVTARKVGKTTITVKTNNGKKATCKVTVKK